MELRQLGPVVKHWLALTSFVQSPQIGLANIKFGQEIHNSKVGLTVWNCSASD
jgi:hypothetical protein